MSTSIVIPVRNQPGCIRWTLESLVRQADGVEDFEVIVVDDESTDDTAATVTAFSDRLDLTLLKNTVNRGRAFSRNSGAAAATGEHLIFMDSDSCSPTNLIAGHQRRHAARPDDVIMGRRVEIGWWSMHRLADGEPITDPLSFEEDQRDSRGLSDSSNDFYARTPWLFVATHNMSLSAELFDKVGDFDEELVGWGYEDNEFAYRAFRFFGREPGHFLYDPELVCYHMPHFRDWDREWHNTTNVLPYLKNKFRHYDVELLSHPPNHLRIAQTMPYYEIGIEYVSSRTGDAVIDRLAELVPSDDRRELWIGCGVGAVATSGRAAICFDHSKPHTEDNYHLLGTYVPYDDDSFSAVVNVDLWRMLNPVDLSSFVMESLRVAGTVYLAVTKDITDDVLHRLGLMSDVRYLVDMFASRYSVDVFIDDDRFVVLRCRASRA